VSYNKNQLSTDDLEAGAKARLVQLNADTKNANAIVRIATGEQVTNEEQAAVDADPQAQTVLTELQGELDMSNTKNALSMAATASTLRSTSSKAYQAIVANNSDKAVTNPTSQAMMQLGMKYSVATQQSAVINKVLDGQSITDKEAGAVIAVGAPRVLAAGKETGNLICGLDRLDKLGLRHDDSINGTAAFAGHSS